MKYGIDYLAGANYQKLIMNNHPEGWGAGFFLHTFGEAFTIVEKLAKKGTAPFIRVHSIWRNSHEWDESCWVVVKKDLEKICKIAKKYPSINFYFSPMCEHTLKKKEVSTLFKKLKEIKGEDSTNVYLVNSVWTGATIDEDGVINEVHSDHKKIKGDYIYSFDGLDAYNANVEKIKNKHKNASMFFFWTISLNLKQSDDERLTVEERIKKGYKPKQVHLEALVALSKNKGETKVPSGIIIKPMSEDCEDLKSNKLLVLSKTKYSKLELVRDNKAKKVIEELKLFNPPTDGYYRFYASEAGYKYQKKKLLKLQGDGYIIKGLTFNGAFRDGTYRN